MVKSGRNQSLSFDRSTPRTTMAVTKRVRIYTEEDVADHKSANSCWITCRGKVYDVTKFVPDHPGGDDLILEHAGTDVESIMKDEGSHDHSDSAYDMLEEYVIGRLGTDSTVVRDGKHSAALYQKTHSWKVFSTDWEASDDFHPEDTNSAEDFEKTQFLDLRTPLLQQMWQANFRYGWEPLTEYVFSDCLDTANPIISNKFISHGICKSLLVFLRMTSLRCAACFLNLCSHLI